MAQFKVLKKCYIPHAGMKLPGAIVTLPDDSKRKYSFLEPLAKEAAAAAPKAPPAGFGGKARASDKE